MTIHVPLITPFDADNEIAYRVLTQVAQETLLAGAGLVALGTTAEAASLSAAERRNVLDLLSDHSEGDLIAGADTPDQLRSLNGKARAALTLVPPFIRPGEDGVVEHFRTLAASSPVPMIVYHVPQRTGQALSADAIRRLAAIDGVIGIKYATGAVDADLVDLLADPPDDFDVFCGDDIFLAPMLAMGAAGAIAASAHIETAAFVDLAAHREPTLARRLARLSKVLFSQPNPIVVKAALHAAGRIPTPGVRPPLLPAAAPSLYGSLLE